MTLTATYDDTLSRVRLSVDGLASATHARFERSVNGVTWSTVRGGTAVPVSGGSASLDDYEFTPNSPNTYRARPRVVETFESATLALAITGDWSRTQEHAHDGAWSLRSAPIGDNATSDAVITVPAGATTLELWWKASTEPGFDFFYVLVDGVQIGNGAAGEFDWTTSGLLDVASASTVTLRYDRDALAGGGENAVWVDDIVFSGFADQSTVITPVISTVWLKSITRPFLNRTIRVTDWSEVERRSRNGVFDVVGRSLPVAVTDVRGSRQYELVVYTQTLDEADDLDTVLASGDPVLIQVPPDCVVPRSMYAVIGDITIARRSVRGTRRYFTLPLTEVAAPDPDIVGATVTWSSIIAAFATWSDLIAAEATWHDVAERIGDPSEVIVP